MLHVACCLWDANAKSQSFSRCYDESWVEKLYRGFARHLTVRWRFVVFTDRERVFLEPIEQERLERLPPDYGSLIEPFKLNEPTIVCGLDTIVLKNIDHMADYCMRPGRLAVVQHPSIPELTINPVVFIPPGHRRIFDHWDGENDMEWLRRQDAIVSDSLWPGQILSLKLHDVRRKGTQGARIVYFHGDPKPNEMGNVDWVKQNWV